MRSKQDVAKEGNNKGVVVVSKEASSNGEGDGIGDGGGEEFTMGTRDGW